MCCLICLVCFDLWTAHKHSEFLHEGKVTYLFKKRQEQNLYLKWEILSIGLFWWYFALSGKLILMISDLFYQNIALFYIMEAPTYEFLAFNVNWNSTKIKIIWKKLDLFKFRWKRCYLSFYRINKIQIQWFSWSMEMDDLLKFFEHLKQFSGCGETEINAVIANINEVWDYPLVKVGDVSQNLS